MVDAELQVEPLGGASRRRAHNAGVVHDDVDAGPPLDDGRSGLPDLIEEGQVEFDEVAVRTHGLRRCGGPDRVAHRHHHLCPMGRHRPCCIEPQSARRAGDDHHFAVQIDTFEHFV